MSSEVREFQLHQNVLFDLIQRQAGSLDKAVLELVMNLIEAGAGRGDITLTPTRLLVVDDGKGFATREEIIAAFEVFGKSDERKAEEKRWAQFQLGRGQAFAKGRTTYRTRTFRMTVDVRACENGVTYTLEENLPDVPGCRVYVQLYDRLQPWLLAHTVSEIETAVKYVDRPIKINGQRIDIDPAKQKWDLTTDEAFIAFDDAENRMRVYNLGVMVKDAYLNGLGGTIVSRHRLQLNFARNDIITNCPVWEAIQGSLEGTQKRELLKKRTFNPKDASVAMSRFYNREYTEEQIGKLPLFRDIKNKKWTPKALMAKRFLSFDKAGSAQGDVAMQVRDVVVLDRKHALEALGRPELRSAYDRFCELFWRLSERPPEFISPEDLYASLPHRHTIVPAEECSHNERQALRLIESEFDAERLASISNRENPSGLRFRRIVLGESEAYQAWTDGSGYIAFDRTFLRRNTSTLAGWVRILTVLCHEYAHLSEDRQHDADFYERFHDQIDAFLRAISRLYKHYSASAQENDTPSARPGEALLLQLIA